MNSITDRDSRQKKASLNHGEAINGKLPLPDYWSFPVAVSRHWAWIALSAVVAGILGFQLWSSYWDNKYVATAQLIRTDNPEYYLAPAQEMAGPTLSEIIDTVEVHSRVGLRMRPLYTSREVANFVEVEPSRNNDLINIFVSLSDEQQAIRLANTYADEAASMTRKMQADEAMGAHQYLEKQMALVQKEIAAVQVELASQPNLVFPGKEATPSRSLALFERLEEAGNELVFLMGRYTLAHPLVKEQRARVGMLEKQVAELGLQEGGGAGREALSVDAGIQHGDGLIEGLLELEAQRVLIAGRMRVTKVTSEAPPGYYRVFAAASDQDVEISSALPLISLLTVVTAGFGFFLATAFFIFVELLDRRMKSPSDIYRVTKLPILAVLGKKRWKHASLREKWAFRTWTSLQNSLSATPNSGLICGFTSSRPKEGRTLWIRALADAANLCGFRVLTITTEDLDKKKTDTAEKDAKAKKKEGSNTDIEETSVAANWMYSPAEITRRVEDPSHPPVVQIPLPGWVWNLDRRKEWFAALEEWRHIENLVILIELPPASSPETVLLAQNLPNLVWLIDSQKAKAPETQDHLETLRNARCNLVGTVVNRAPATFKRNRFARWQSAAVAAVCFVASFLDVTPRLSAETIGADSARASANLPERRADWQRSLTLGSGDVLQISLIGAPELTRDAVVIQSDGKISFLEAQALHAAGLSVDELRASIDEALSEFRRSPRTSVVPIAYQSKKYYMLGRIAQTGTYSLERPLTIVEAVARAQGFQTGLVAQSQNQGELVDFSRSFLVRDGKRYNVDFKELFAAGNLEHNIYVEPNDYFYFPPARPQEVYLLGAFDTQGPVDLTEGLSVVRAVASRGGLSPEAWKKNILVVRGSLGDPETFRVSMADVVAGRASDVPLQPGDIVYVSERPWIRAEQLLDDVISAFAQTVTIYWTTDNVLSR